MTKTSADIRSLARSHTATAVRTLAGIKKERRAPAAARVSAAIALDRGWGKRVSTDAKGRRTGSRAQVAVIENTIWKQRTTDFYGL